MLRISAGAVILGSNVSICEGPPCKKSSTTALSLTMRRPSSVACTPSSCDNVKPPSARLPTRNNSRRVIPPQVRVNEVSEIRNMKAPLRLLPHLLSAQVHALLYQFNAPTRARFRNI